MLALFSAVIAAEGPENSALAVTENASVKFSVTIFSLFKKTGQFERVDANFKHSAASVLVYASIAADSVVMRSKSDAALLMSAPYFDASRYPKIRFVSDAIPYEILGSGGNISGKLSLRGKTLAQQFLVHPSPCAARLHAQGVEAPTELCVIEIEGSLQRSDFGMTARRGIVSDKVELMLRVPIARADPLPAPP